MSPQTATLCVLSAALAVLAIGASRQPTEPPPTAAPTPAAAPPAPWVPLKSQFLYNVPFVEVKIGDSTGWFMLDTGCYSTILDETWAKHIGLEVVQAKPTGTELVGRSFAPNVAIEIGSASLKLNSMWCRDFRSLYPPKDIQICGAIGGDFFADHLVRIRYSEKGVDLGSPQTPGFVPGSILIPVHVADVPYTTIVVTQESQDPMGMTAIIDSGCVGGIVLSGPRARHLAVAHGESEPFRTLSGEGVAHRAAAVTVGMGAFSAGPADVLVDDNEHESDNALIGAELLSQFTVIIDYPRGLIVLAPGKFNPEDSRKGLGFSMEVNITLGAALVGSVTPGKSADRAGLRKGDVILAVNGDEVDVAQAGMAGLSPISMAALKSGKPVTLHVRRADQTLDITIDPTPPTKSGER